MRSQEKSASLVEFVDFFFDERFNGLANEKYSVYEVHDEAEDLGNRARKKERKTRRGESEDEEEDLGEKGKKKERKTRRGDSEDEEENLVEKAKKRERKTRRGDSEDEEEDLRHKAKKKERRTRRGGDSEDDEEDLGEKAKKKDSYESFFAPKIVLFPGSQIFVRFLEVIKQKTIILKIDPRGVGSLRGGRYGRFPAAVTNGTLRTSQARTYWRIWKKERRKEGFGCY